MTTTSSSVIAAKPWQHVARLASVACRRPPLAELHIVTSTPHSTRGSVEGDHVASGGDEEGSPPKHVEVPERIRCLYTALGCGCLATVTTLGPEEESGDAGPIQGQRYVPPIQGDTEPAHVSVACVCCTAVFSGLSKSLTITIPPSVLASDGRMPNSLKIMRRATSLGLEEHATMSQLHLTRESFGREGVEALRCPRPPIEGLETVGGM